MKITIKELRKLIRNVLSEDMRVMRRTSTNRQGRAPGQDDRRPTMAHAGPSAAWLDAHFDDDENTAWQADTEEHDAYAAAWPGPGDEQGAWLYGAEEPLQDELYDMDDFGEDEDEEELDPREMGWRQ